MGEDQGMTAKAASNESETDSPGMAAGQVFDFAGTRLNREWKTMVAMIRIYCRDRHQTANGLCADCQQLMDYAHVRLQRCRFGAEKPTCAKCPVHCYQRTRREEVRAVMRYAGPRMLWEHPVMSLRHWLDGFRNAPGW